MTKKDYYFKQFDKIADLKLRERCKELYDDLHSRTRPQDISSAILGMCMWEETDEGFDYWENIWSLTEYDLAMVIRVSIVI